MRLLERDDTGEFRLTKQLPTDTIPEIPPYAVLSHTWDDEEVFFRDLWDGTAKKKAGYAKIRFCGEQAERDGLRYFWVDTCCIDKSDAAELQHALNSMFQWYRNAAKCYVYLADVSTNQQSITDSPDWKLVVRQSGCVTQRWTFKALTSPAITKLFSRGWRPAFQQSRWFTRGWTLQELIAPMAVEFFSREGERLGDKKSLEQEICNITGIPQRALQGSPLSDYSVAERMRWIEKRNTNYEEDKVYSLFGIFDVHIPILYGEGKEKAFDRLREKINKNSQRLARLWPAHPLDPRDQKKRIELARGGLLVDAYRWVFDNPDFNRWYQLSESRLLWIKGDPGKGKTMLLCGIINELERPITVNGGNLAYFFCQDTDSRINNATSVLRGLIYLLVQRQPRLLLHLPENTYPSDDAIAWIVLSKTLIEMLEDPNLKATYLVIDALDECVIDQQKLLSLIVQMSSISARVKCVVSSRNWLQIEEQLASVAQQSRLSLELNDESVTAAVEAFIRHKVLCLSQLKQYDSTMEDFIREYLSFNANGTFLWVALVCQALADPKVRKRHALTKLRTFPPGLDDFYARMMEQIGDSEDADLCKEILTVTTIVRRPISLPELTTFVEMGGDISDLEELIRLCGSFLTLRKQIVYFVHQSAKDFLQGKATHKASREAFKQVFPLGTETVNYIIFSKSLDAMSIALRRDMYGLKAPGFPIDKVQTPSPDPLDTVRYSCVFWVDHLRDSTSDKGMPQPKSLDAVHAFVKQKYLYWLEALSLLRAMPEGVIAITQLNGLLGRTSNSQLTKLVWDAYRFTLAYGGIISQAPLQAYITALVFAPTSSLVKKNFREEEPSWVRTKPVVEVEWNACLQTLQGHSGSVYSATFSYDGQRLASGSSDKTIKIWDTSGQCIQTLEGHRGSVRSIAFAPDCRQLASSSDDKTIKIWDTVSRQCSQILEGHQDSITSVTFSPDCQRLASGSGFYDKTIKIWDIALGQCLWTLESHTDSVNSVAFSPDGRRLASGSDDKTIKIWDTALGQCLWTLDSHIDSVNSVAFSPDSQLLASGAGFYDKTVKIWDVASSQCIQTFNGHRGSINLVAFSPDGQHFASSSHDKTIKVWDVTSGQCLQTLEGHHDSINSVAFSPDGQQLASGSEDCTIKIWDTVPGRYLPTLERHYGSVLSVAFSPDGERLVSGSHDNTVKIWDTTSGLCLESIDAGTSIHQVSFDHTGRNLHTNVGRIRIANASAGNPIHPHDPVQFEYCLGQDKSWITCNGCNVLWLPPEYRLSCFAIQGQQIAIGCASGRVLTIGFRKGV
ncbi:Vegetative incompatibility protein HET-E-1 [Rhypophila decipiens]